MIKKEFPASESFIKGLRKAITERTGFKVQEVLNRLKSDIKGVGVARFRPVDWKGKAVIYVPGWVTPKDPQEVHPQLFRRVFFDPKDPSQMDCLVGLVARIVIIGEEEMGRGSISHSGLKEEVENREIERPRYCFNDVKNEPTFNSFIARLNEGKTELEKIKKEWDDFYQKIKKIDKNDDFFNKLQDLNPPWMSDDKKMAQWIQLMSSLDHPREDNFLVQVNDTVKYYKTLYNQWKKYISKTDQHKCEIAVPVVAAGKLIGILNLHRNEPYTKDETELCLDYASLLAIVCMRIQTELLENLQKVAETMTAESSLEEIASEIAKGIRESLVGLNPKDVYPLLYVCKRPISPEDKLLDFEDRWVYQRRHKPKKDEDKLWETEEKLGPIPIRENGLGKNAVTKWKYRARLQKAVRASGYFVVSGDVDNPDSSSGSRSALKHKIKTTGCLPLIFNRQVYGLLYLHCTKRHFFTQSELEALETFGTQAAIAINNAKLVGPSYKQLYGSTLLDSLKGGKK